MHDYLIRRRARVAAALGLKDELLLVGSGEPVPIPGGADQTYRFLPHAEYRYLTDRAEPGGLVAFDAAGGWADFLPPVTEGEQVWEGRRPFEWTDARPLSELAGWLAARRGRPVVNLGAPVPGVHGDASRVDAIRSALMAARRPKDEVELDRIRRAVAATAAGFAKARETIKPGVTERLVQVEMEAEFFRRGADRTGYGSIVGTGSNAAVLHFSPSERAIKPGELVLIDAGGEIDGYTADVTRTYNAEGELGGGHSGAVGVSGSAGRGSVGPIGGHGSGGAGKHGSFPAELYAVVLRAQKAAIDRCTAGTEYRDIHMAAARDMAAGLVEIGILKGNADELVERDAHALFFPHGLGHLVGLGVRDASGYLPGRTRSTRFGLSALRIDLPLQPGFVVTIEPGLYFIPALLQDPARRKQYADCIHWAKVDTLLDVGGVRIEDNILVTEGKPVNLTAGIPK